jgi:hypothetical protein
VVSLLTCRIVNFYLNLKPDMFPFHKHVGTSHSATGAIESALKYVSPDAHWIARRLATAGGKRIKTRPLSAIDTEKCHWGDYCLCGH